MEHAYGVRLFAADAKDVAWYTPWCDCGWTGFRTMDEKEAIITAYVHATRKEPEPVSRRLPKPRQLQEESMFDAEEYEI